MPKIKHLAVTAALLLVWPGFRPTFSEAAEPVDEIARLARHVPPDARLFLELREMDTWVAAPGGSPLTTMVRDLVGVSASRPASGPADGAATDWRQLLAEGIQLADPETSALLFSGRLALAADNWNTLAAAVMLVDPEEPAALEAKLTERLVAETEKQPVRRYRLGRQHELACDGQVVLIGRPMKPTSLYNRALDLLASKHGVSLRDLAEFRSRISSIPASSSIVVYLGSNRRAGEPPEQDSPSIWWPRSWPRLASAAIGAVVTNDGATVDFCSRLEAPASQWVPSYLPIETLSRLPASTVAAWTNSVNYGAEFRRLDAANVRGPVRLYLDVLQSGLEEGAIQRQLLSHLVGETVFVIARAEADPGLVEGDDSLVLPAICVAVETDDPEAVDRMMMRLTANLLQLLNLTSVRETAFPLKTLPLGEGNGVVRSIHIGRLYEGQTACEFLRDVELSWTVADRWLILGTDGKTVRDMALARRGELAAMPVGSVHEVLREVQMSGGSANMLLLGQPSLGSAMIDSWLAYIAEHHPQMLEPDWWQQLRRRHRASSIQLGFYHPKSVDGRIEVERTLPNWPAHGRLQPGDLIVAVNGHELDQERTRASFGRLVAMREKPDEVVVRVIRGDEELDVVIPMPVPDHPADRIEPVSMLRQLAEIMRPFASASYASWQPSAELLNARIELRFVPATARGE